MLVLRNHRGLAKLRRQLVSGLAVALCVALPAATASASAQRTFVSPGGSDGNTGNNCSLLLPCRSFGAAITVTNTGGEIIVLDSAGYGPVAITKSVAIISPPGIYAGVSVLSGEGITINTPGINVALKGLTINGQGGTYGIHYSQGSRFEIDGCTVSGMSIDGILIDGPGTITISNATVLGNSGTGININAAAVVNISESLVQSNTQSGIAVRQGANATVDHTTVVQNGGRGVGVFGVVSGTRVAIVASVITDNALDGVFAQTTGASLVSRLDVAGSTIARNQNGVTLDAVGGGTVTSGVVNNQIVENIGSGVLASGAGATARVSRNAVFRNAVGFNTSAGGTLFSPTTNYVRDNTTNGAASADSLL